MKKLFIIALLCVMLVSWVEYSKEKEAATLNTSVTTDQTETVVRYYPSYIYDNSYGYESERNHSTVLCPWCHGSTVCKECNGTRKNNASSMVLSAMGCQLCDRTGVCVKCRGTGYIG